MYLGIKIKFPRGKSKTNFPRNLSHVTNSWLEHFNLYFCRLQSNFPQLIRQSKRAHFTDMRTTVYSIRNTRTSKIGYKNNLKINPNIYSTKFKLSNFFRWSKDKNI